jgi:enterochelin esterase-like enzyme
MRLLLVFIVIAANTWLAEGPANSAPVHGWVTGPANTTLATYHVFTSPAVGESVSYHVYRPTAHQAEPERRFPVLYWLHGSGEGILGIPGLCQFFNDAINTGQIPPAMIVFPNGLTPPGMWCNSKDGLTPVESMLINDLIPHIDATERTLATRNGRILEGFSMGGYGAGRLGLKHHHLFRAISMMGAGPLQLNFLEDDPNLAPINQRVQLFEQVWGSDMDYYLLQHPWTIAQAQANNLPGDLRLRIIIGTADSLLANNRLFRDRIASIQIPHEYLEINGIGHQPLPLISSIGPSNWAFYTAVLQPLQTGVPSWELYE